MRHSIACATGVSARSGCDRQPLAERNPQLPLHEIDPRHHLRDRMLDLQPRVHLEEIELAVLVEQELDGAGVRVADRPGHERGALGHAPRACPASSASDGDSSTTF